MSITEYPSTTDSHENANQVAAPNTEAGPLPRVLSERDQLASRVSQLDDQLTLAQRELTAFKDRVVQVAMDYAEQHAWCEVVDQALTELGLQRPPFRYRAELVIRVEFSATRTSARRLPDPGWVRDSILGIGDIREAIREHFAMDSDHADWALENIDLSVDDVQDAS